MTTRILTANYVRPTDAYVAEVFMPAFAAVASQTPFIERRYRIADRGVRIRFYSEELVARLTQALAHLQDFNPSTADDLTIDVWDSASSGSMLTPPWRTPRHHFPQEVQAQMPSDAATLAVYVHGEESLSVYDPATQHAWYWVSAAENLPFWVSAAPLRTIFSWFLSGHAVHLVHGAVVAEGGKAALLAARGGSGKSTTALACALAGMEYLADDYAGIGLGADILVHSLYASVKIVPERASEFPVLFPAVPADETEKQIAFLTTSARMGNSTKLAAIFIPVLRHSAETRIVPASKAEAMLALVPTTLFQLPLGEADKIATFAEIVRRTPCYRLELGLDPAEAAQVIREAVRKAP